MVWGIQNHKPFGWDILGLLLPVPRGCVPRNPVAVKDKNVDKKGTFGQNLEPS